MTNILKNLADSTGKLVETIPELYSDLAQPTVQETGKMIARIPRLINAALAPLDQWILKKEYNIEETKKLLEQKLQDVEEEKIVTPDSYVAVPALQAISYSMDSEELRNLYANLLAKSMNIDTKDYVHPSFVEIIKQLSPIDANVFKIIFTRQLNPIVDICRQNKQSVGKIVIYPLVTDISIASYELVSTAITNLATQGLIEILDLEYTDEKNYTSIWDSKIYLELTKNLQIPETDTIQIQKKVISVTPLGRLFFNICVNDNI